MSTPSSIHCSVIRYRNGFKAKVSIWDNGRFMYSFTEPEMGEWFTTEADAMSHAQERRRDLLAQNGITE